MDWATERNLPISLYLELEDQPARRTPKTIKEPMQKNATKLKFIEAIKYNLGMVNQRNKERNKERWGASP